MFLWVYIWISRILVGWMSEKNKLFVDFFVFSRVQAFKWKKSIVHQNFFEFDPRSSRAVFERGGKKEGDRKIFFATFFMRVWMRILGKFRFRNRNLIFIIFPSEIRQNLYIFLYEKSGNTSVSNAKILAIWFLTLHDEIIRLFRKNFYHGFTQSFERKIST